MDLLLEGLLSLYLPVTQTHQCMAMLLGSVDFILAKLELSLKEKKSTEQTVTCFCHMARTAILMLVSAFCSGKEAKR